MLNLFAGLIVTIALGAGAKPLLRYAGGSMPLVPPSKASDEQKRQWLELVKGSEGGAILGWLERLMFFAAFLLAAHIAVAAWLAFKVASKWQAWATVISIPDKLEIWNDDLDYLIARRRWGSHLLMTFLIGTAYNILVGMAGAAVVLYGDALTAAVTN